MPHVSPMLDCPPDHHPAARTRRQGEALVPPPAVPYVDDGWAPPGFTRASWEDLGWLRRWARAGSDPQADFARYMGPPLQPPVTGPRVFGWVHVATIGRWEWIARELFSQVERSGLRAATSRVFVGVVGPDADLSWFPPWAEVVRRDGALELGENSTLEALWAWSKTVGPGKVWYAHTKGAARPNASQIIAWRDYLAYWNILRWRACVTALDAHDACGVDFFDDDAGGSAWFKALWGAPHLRGAGFAGNFFWATTGYLAGLPPARVNLVSERHNAEWDFIGTGSPRVWCPYQSRNNFYQTAYPRARYDPAVAGDPP